MNDRSDSITLEIRTIAVLLTCYNRKDKTLACLKQLYDSKFASAIHFEMDVYLTDDGSDDGSGAAIKENFPDVIIISGNGKLFWAGGMRNSWNEALKKHYDGFLLLFL